MILYPINENNKHLCTVEYIFWNGVAMENRKIKMSKEDANLLISSLGAPFDILINDKIDIKTQMGGLSFKPEVLANGDISLKPIGLSAMAMPAILAVPSFKREIENNECLDLADNLLNIRLSKLNLPKKLREKFNLPGNSHVKAKTIDLKKDVLEFEMVAK